MPTPTAKVPPPGEEFGRRVADRYRIVRKIGEGGMGCVYEAVHELLGRRVALKTLSASRIEGENATARFHREARAAASIATPHVVEVFDFGTDRDGSPFLVMELLVGEDLGKRLAREQRLTIARTVRIGREACEALGAAHEKGIVHRDIKPENLFLCERTNDTDFLKVLDFGIARIDRNTDAPTVTTTGSMTGTPRYMAPEQIEGFAVDARTDVYALAVVLYRALAGVEPFQGPTHHMLLLRILADEPPSLRRVRPDVSEELERTIFRALSKRPDDRYDSAAAFAEALLRALPLSANDDADAANAANAELAGGGGVGADAGHATSRTDRVKPLPPSTHRPVAPYVRRRLPKYAWLVAWPLVAASMAAGFRFARSTRPATLRPLAMRRPTEVTAAAEREGERLANTRGADPSRRSRRGSASDAKPDEVTVELSIAPTCASVTIDDVAVTNPATLRRARSDRPVRLHATCSGMPTLDAELVFDHDQRISLALPERPRIVAHRAHGIAASVTRQGTMLADSPSGTPQAADSNDGFLDEF